MDRARELYRRTVYAIGPKKLASALGLSLGHVYRLTRDPMDTDSPEATGAERTEVDRLDLMWDLLAADPEDRPLLHEWELLIRQGFDRRLRRKVLRVSHGDVIGAAAKCAREHGEALAEAMTEGDDARALTECAESMECLRELMDLLSAKIDSERTISLHRSA